jgi:hypothetical protein
MRRWNARERAMIVRRAVQFAGLMLAGMVGVAAGEAAKPAARDLSRDLFVVFSAANAAKAPSLTGDPGVAKDITPSLAAFGDRRAAGFQIKFTPTQRYAALLLDATSVPKVFSDPELPVEPELLVVT